MLANLQRRYQSYRWGEPELRLVGRLADPRRIAIDVGGYDGEYTRAMKRHARACLTFEPNPRKYALLQQTDAAVKGAGVLSKTDVGGGQNALAAMMGLGGPQAGAEATGGGGV